MAQHTQSMLQSLHITVYRATTNTNS